jgi:hypothetical protein
MFSTYNSKKLIDCHSKFLQINTESGDSTSLTYFNQIKI